MSKPVLPCPRRAWVLVTFFILPHLGGENDISGLFNWHVLVITDLCTVLDCIVPVNFLLITLSAFSQCIVRHLIAAP